MASQSLVGERRVNATDSAVTLGCWAKGRSSSQPINNQLRGSLGWQILGRKQLANFHVRSEANPSDDPSRAVPLRQPLKSPRWLRRFLKATPSRCHWEPLPSSRRWAVEAYSGCGRLSQALREQGMLVRSLEAYPAKRTYMRYHDLDKPSVVYVLICAIKSGHIRHVHFGVPCKSWGRSNRLNGGTRRLDAPMGGSCPLPRELLGNQQAAVMCDICQVLADHNCLFTIENPSDSHLFRSTHVQRLMNAVSCYLVKFDQCAYNLTLPDAPPKTFCRKTTAILANFSSISALGLKCPGISAEHQHEHAWGQRNGMSLTASAGRYPAALCSRLAELVKAEW